ncbi:hypothetical protein SNE40_023285 [Patella caerulea]
MATIYRTISVEALGISGNVQPTSDCMKYEWMRLGSFKSFPRQSEGRPIKLAKAGFIFTGTREGDDTVTCFMCGVTKNSWLKYENPLQIHKDLNPRCNFINNTSTNVGILVPEPTVYHKILETLRNTYCVNHRNRPVECYNSSPKDDSDPIPVYSSELEISISSFNIASSDRFTQAMVVEEARQRTFQNWPRYLTVRPTELARAGFYHLGSADLVRCAFCGGILRNWEEAESPVAEHWRCFSSCEFLRGVDQSNVPIIPNDTYVHDYVSTHPPSSTDEDVRAALDPLSTILNNGNLNLVQNDAPATAEDLFIVTQAAAQPEKAKLATRLATFANWPRRSPVPSTEQIAEAGFYFLDKEDAVKCFFCGGVLKSWRDEDIAWNEHAKWFPTCAYLLRIKGQDFVNSMHQPDTGTAKVVGTTGSTSVIALVMDSVTTDSEIKGNGDVIKTEHPVVTDKDHRVSNGTLAAAEAGPAKQQATESAANAGTDAIPGEGENQESPQLLRENEELKEQRLCKICMDAESNIVLLPCGHLVSCELCAPALTKCPMCRKALRGSVKTYLSLK